MPNRAPDSFRTVLLVPRGGFSTVSRCTCLPAPQHPHTPIHEAPSHPHRAPSFQASAVAIPRPQVTLPSRSCSHSKLRPTTQGSAPPWLASSWSGPSRARPGIKPRELCWQHQHVSPNFGPTRVGRTNSSPANQHTAGAMAGECPSTGHAALSPRLSAGPCTQNWAQLSSLTQNGKTKGVRIPDEP